MSTDMKQAFEFAQAAYAELLPGHNLYLDAAEPMVVDAETGVYIAPATHETRTIRGAEQVPGYGVFRVHVWGGGPDQPEDAGEVALSTHRHYTQAVREMLRQSFEVKMDKLSAIDFQDQIVP